MTAWWRGLAHGLQAARFPATLALPLAIGGWGLMAAGMALRWWAIRVLAEWFTVDVAIRPGRRRVRRGPYRLLRHPSCTGALMTFLGFSRALGDRWALLVLPLPVTAAFAWRIRVAERVLANAFADEYPA